MEIPRLNIRHTLPQIGINMHLGKLETTPIQPVYHGSFKQARCNQGVTLSKLEIDSYPSRKAYGHLSDDDFAKKYGQQGFEDLKKTTSAHTQQAWDNIDNAAKPGSGRPMNIYDQKLAEEINKQQYMATQIIPDPIIHFTPCQVKGDMDLAKETTDIEVQPKAESHFTPGQVETYLKQKGDIQRWVSQGEYDIYA